MKPINVLSLCDGISTGQVSLRKAGIPYKFYAASEIDKYAIKETTRNFPATLQLGNLYDVNVDRIPFDIDLVLMGFPCQGFSLAGKQLNFDDPRSQLFFRGLKILQRCRDYNPNVKFLFENVRMNKESEKIITTMLGVQPIMIDAALVSGQTRKRNYWTNIEAVEQPEDRGIILQDILEEDVDEKYYLSEKILARINTDAVYKKMVELKLKRDKSRAIIASVGRTTDREYFKKSQGQLVEVVGKMNESQDGKNLSVSGKSQCLVAGNYNVPKIAQVNPAKEFGDQPRNQHRIYDADYKSPALTSTKLHTTNIAFGVDNAKGNIRVLSGDKSLNIDANYHKGIDNHAQRTMVGEYLPVADCNRQGKLKKNQDKAGTLTVGGHGAGNHSDMDVIVHNLQPREGKGVGGKGHIMRYPGNKAYCLDTGNNQAVEYNLVIRRLTPTEAGRLQGMPDGYLSGISDSAAYRCYGNGWQADAVAHILRNLAIQDITPKPKALK